MEALERRIPIIPILAVMSAFHLFVYGYIKAIVLYMTPDRYRNVKKKDVTGQIVLITGAGSGLGRKLAIDFSNLSATVILVDLYEISLQDTKNQMTCKENVHLFQCDVSDRKKVYEMAKQIKTEIGKVDILVNNAGIVAGRTFLELDDYMIQKTVEVNSLSHFWMCKAFLPEMIESGRGHIVSVASLAGLTGFPFLTDYCASKYAAVGLMESLKLELAAKKVDGVKLTLVCPGLVSTGLFEGAKPALTPTMTPDYVAGKMMDAILEEKEVLLLPGWSVILIIFRWMMPQKAVDKFYQNSGLLEFMNSFKGRTDNNNVPHIKAS